MTKWGMKYLSRPSVSPLPLYSVSLETDLYRKYYWILFLQEWGNTGNISGGGKIWIFILLAPLWGHHHNWLCYLTEGHMSWLVPFSVQPPLFFLIASTWFFWLRDSNNSCCFVLGRYLLYFLLISQFPITSL